MTTTIRSTKNYDLFELHDFNRDVKKISKLESLMRREGWIDAYPMHVQKNGGRVLKIKAGHHRFTVAKRLGIPVKFVVCNDTTTISEIEEATNPWSTKDYLVSYVRTEMPDYVAVKEYVDETGISITAAMAILSGRVSGGGGKIKQFKSGNYKVGDTSLADKIKDIVLHLKPINKQISTNSYFITALSKAVLVYGFDIERFKTKATNHSHLFEKQPDVKSYLSLIESIYNRASTKKMPVAFLAEEAARTRSVSFGK